MIVLNDIINHDLKQIQICITYRLRIVTYRCLIYEIICPALQVPHLLIKAY